MTELLQIPPELNASASVDKVLETSLLGPLRLFLNNGGKNVRPLLVELGLRFSLPEEQEEFVSQSRNKLLIASTVIESIHSGSLIIDDIQDQSLIRRNLPTFHLQHGLPLALNAGNWLYFWALEQIRFLELSPERGQILLFDVLKIMTKAHYGQALDLGGKIDEVEQQSVFDLVKTSMELKTGSLFELAIVLGASVADCTADDRLKRLAIELGTCLQVYDDIGNFLTEKPDDSLKRHEDLRNKRPTWVWAQASLLSQNSYLEFKQSVSVLPDEAALSDWILKHDFKNQLRCSAQELLKKTVMEFQKSWGSTHPMALDILRRIENKLENSYV